MLQIVTYNSPINIWFSNLHVLQFIFVLIILILFNW